MFTIAKYAENGVWQNYYGKDPKLGVPLTLSTYFTFIGKQCGMRKHSYETREELEIILLRIRKEDKLGSYAICKILDYKDGEIQQIGEINQT